MSGVHSKSGLPVSQVGGQQVVIFGSKVEQEAVFPLRSEEHSSNKGSVLDLRECRCFPIPKVAPQRPCKIDQVLRQN